MSAEAEAGQGPSQGNGPASASGLPRHDEKDERGVLLSHPEDPTPSAATRQQSPWAQAVAWLPALLSTVLVVVILYALQGTLSSRAVDVATPWGGAGAMANTGLGELSPAQVEDLLGLLSQRQECPQDEGGNATVACRLARAVLSRAMAQAEEQYNTNIRTRNALDAGSLLTNPRMPLVRLKEAILVPTWPCPMEGRFGLWGEGGKWLCLVHAGVTQAPYTISIGSKGDVSFESEVYARLNATIHTFDPTLDRNQQKRMLSIPFLTFHNAGLSGRNQIAATRAKFPPPFRNAVLLTVPQMLEALNKPYIDVLKIDCEGCEYGVVQDMVALYNRTSVPFGQILAEIHFMTKKWIAARNLVAMLEGLGYRMFHAEPNAYYAAGYEVAFIHESLTRV